MLAPWPRLSLGERSLERVDQHRPRPPRLDHLVDVAPLGARIIFVVDAYDAMTSDRVYRGRLSAPEALAELERCAGTQFDPEVVTALAEELELAGIPETAALAS